jgi:hypothetical protein
MISAEGRKELNLKDQTTGLDCRDCMRPIRRARRVDRTGPPDGIIIDGIGVGAPAGAYHLDCLGFCPNCEEVESIGYLTTWPVCRLCVRTAHSAVSELFRLTGPEAMRKRQT